MKEWERSRQEGRQQGLEEGRQEARIKVTKNAIIKGIKIEDIIDLTGMTEKEIEEIRKGMLEDIENGTDGLGELDIGVKTPNSETIEAMLEAEKLSCDSKAKRYSSFKQALGEVIGDESN